MKTIRPLPSITQLALGLLTALGPLRAGADKASSTIQCAAGDLRMTFHASGDGLRVERVWDEGTQVTLATGAAPLFTLVLRDVNTKQERRLQAGEGWREVRADSSRAGLTLTWKADAKGEFAGLEVKAKALVDRDAERVRWTLAVDNVSAVWAVRRVVFPQLSLAEPGEAGVLFFPRGPGEEQRGVWRRDFHYRGNYPDGWCSMQFLATYRPGDRPTGLYLGLHDPLGSTKHLDLKSSADARQVQAAFEVPAQNLNKAGNDFELSGQAVWQLLRGDWFDAATLYRDWAKREAAWWPALGKDGRKDTPQWMRELCAWVMTGGAPDECVPGVKKFRETLGLPVGYHWYNWHQIPFDNDYPHYFPTKPGFARGVAELQQAGVFAMPYINGRLWDSKDRGAEDGAFTQQALPAATKQEDGQPFLEAYGSKETNGQPVRLAVMCPTTSLWRETVRGIVLRLLRDEGCRGVYIDQIAAAAPTLCQDATHGHPLGGGHWWTEGYWELLKAIRGKMPEETMLTTECNGEPFIRWFDGYLTWHWQYDGQVPAFPAVYGGTIQMFGRAYRGGATKELALRTKAAQQLVFGEQIGWFDPGQALEPENLDFLRKTILTRWNGRRFFYAGEMARPPRLDGELPKVKSDWQWSGEWWVTTDAVLTGAWQIPAERRALVMFANPSDETVKRPYRFDADAFALTGATLRRVVRRDGQSGGPAVAVPHRFTEEIVLAPRTVLAWEFATDK